LLLLLLLEAFPKFSLLASNCTMMNNSVRVEQEICSNWIVSNDEFCVFLCCGNRKWHRDDNVEVKKANPIAREPI
jgi:hypothetical protein